MVRSQSVAGLPFTPGNKLERQASLAVRWMGRAALATDLLVRLLYLFFAFESLLGDKGEGEKAGLIALRRAMLSAARGRGSRARAGRTGCTTKFGLLRCMAVSHPK